MAREKTLSAKQRKAIEMLTSGEGYKLGDIAEEVGVNFKTLWRWRNEPEFAHFQAEIEQINNERWEATVDAAREGAKKLVKEGNQKMIEFVLKNAGYNPTQKVEADVKEIIINIEE